MQNVRAWSLHSVNIQQSLFLFVSVVILFIDNMCEKRTRKIKKGSHITRLREARRIQRLQRIASPSTSDESNSSPCPPTVDKAAQNRVILELAWKTVALMHKNRLIQQKIIDLQKETSQYIQSVMSNPENRRRYMEHVRLYGAQPTQLKLLAAEKNVQVKVEPKAWAPI